MDPSVKLGLWLGIGGGVIGLLGGVLGTYASYRAAKSSRERRFVVKAAVLMCAAAAGFLALTLTLSTPYRGLLWLPYAALTVPLIIWVNRRLAALRHEG